jgi:hypothetical protein
MSENSSIHVTTATRLSSVTDFKLESLYVSQYNCEGYKSMPFDPNFGKETTEAGSTTARPFGDIVSDIAAFGHKNLVADVVPGRYLSMTPHTDGIDGIRAFHIVAHQTPSAQHSFNYIRPDTTATMDTDILKSFAASWRNMYQTEAVYTSVSLDVLYTPLVERVFMCYWSLLFNNPAAPLQLAANNWSNTSGWTTHGGQLHAGPGAADPIVSTFLDQTIPIKLPSNLNIESVRYGLTLLAVASRAHFYPIVGGGNPFSNFCIATPGRTLFLSNRDIPAVVDLNSTNALRALREVSHILDYLGVSSAVFTGAASGALRANWILPDLYSIPSLVDDAMYNDSTALIRSDAEWIILIEALNRCDFSQFPVAAAWLRQMAQDVEHGIRTRMEVFLRCDKDALSIIAHIKANPDLANARKHIQVRNVAAYNSSATAREAYIRPITLFGFRVTRNQYSWQTHLYLSHLQQTKADSTNVTGAPIDRSWLPQYSVNFLGAACLLLGNAENVAINQAPVTRFSVTGGYSGVLNTAVSNIEIDGGSLLVPANSIASFTSALSINQMYTVGFTVVPTTATSTVQNLPPNTAQRFGEALITFADPKLVLATIGAWTPQLPVKLSGLRKVYKAISKPTLIHDNFEIDGVIDLRILLYRAALFHHLTPQLTSITSINTDGYPELVHDLPVYTAPYLGIVRALPELTLNLAPVFMFDKLAKPRLQHNPVTGSNVYNSAVVVCIPDLRFTTGVYPVVDPVQQIPLITLKARAQLQAMLKKISIIPIAEEPLSQNQKDAKMKLGQSSATMESDKTHALDPVTIHAGMSELKLTPTDPITQISRIDPGGGASNVNPAERAGF